MDYQKSVAYRDAIHQLIPGGCHTYSKGDDQFPAESPAAISKGKGAYVWDLDGNKFLDCSMGLTSISLGHAFPSVLNKVKAELDKGVNFQRPSYIEREAAETFLSLIPQHQMVKFCKNGSTATTASLKVARAYTKRDMVAFPSDHPFYSFDDWFISQTECPLGIPQEVSKLSLTYNSQSPDSLQKLFEQFPGRIAGVISEPQKPGRLNEMKNLRAMIEISHRFGALFICDEMVTGFKVDFPGCMTKYKYDADLATWGKGIANGFSACALTGKREVMDIGGITNIGAEKLFLISTTHGGETHSLAALIATIEEFKRHDVIKHNHSIGASLLKNVKYCTESAELENYIDISDDHWMITFNFRDAAGQICLGLKTLVLQEMIKRGVLFQGSFVPCFSHNENDIQFFCKAWKQTLEVYKDALTSGYKKFLHGPPIKPVFRRTI